MNERAGWRRRYGRGGVIILVCAMAWGVLASASEASRSVRSAAPGEVASLNAMLPASLQQAGVVATPVDSDYPPFEYLAKNGQETGLSADLMQAAFKLLGIKPQVKIVSFDAILPGFAAKRYVVSMASINVTPERAKVVDFVTYFKGGDAFYENSSATLHVPGSYTAVCGTDGRGRAGQ